jgi:hypothetical protein
MKPCLRYRCVSFDGEDEDFDVSIIVVATEGEDRYSNTLKDLPRTKAGWETVHSKGL